MVFIDVMSFFHCVKYAHFVITLSLITNISNSVLLKVFIACLGLSTIGSLQLKLVFNNIGITHVDNTARIQTVNKEFNEKFYNIINEFYKITGIPMLLNTSFNCQEPIVEAPHHALRTFRRTALDLLVINDWIIRK